MTQVVPADTTQRGILYVVVDDTIIKFTGTDTVTFKHPGMTSVSACLQDIVYGRMVRGFHIPADEVSSVEVLSGLHSGLCLVGSGERSYLFDIETHKSVAEFDVTPSYIYFSPYSDMFSVVFDGRVEIYRRPFTNLPLTTLPIRDVINVVYFSDKEHMILHCATSKLYTYNLLSDHLYAPTEVSVTPIVASPCGTSVACVSTGGELMYRTPHCIISSGVSADEVLDHVQGCTLYNHGGWSHLYPPATILDAKYKNVVLSEDGFISVNCTSDNIVDVVIRYKSGLKLSRSFTGKLIRFGYTKL